MYIALVFCLALGAIGAHGSVLAPGYELGSLYSGYDGEYAGKYDNYQPRSYAFEYGVSDPHTGDHKNQWETKDKDGTVRGSYSLLEADGTTRIVDYIADEHGFRAVVKKVGVHGTSVESHGGAEVEHTPQLEVVAPTAHAEYQPTVIEEPVAYKSYDGGYEDYTDLKPILNDVYTNPHEYIQAPKAEGLLIRVPEHQEEYPASYSQELLYPKAEGLKITLPEEYWSEQYVLPQEKYVLSQEKYVLPQEKYVLPQEKYVLPQEKYVLSQEKYVLPQEKYVLQQEKYVLPQEKYVLPQQKYVLSQESYALPQEKHSSWPQEYYTAPKQIQEYVVPEYKSVSQWKAPVPAPIPEYKLVEQYQTPVAHEVPHANNEYVVPQASLGKGAYSYVEEHRYNTPKGKAVLVESPKAEYNLNLDYNY